MIVETTIKHRSVLIVFRLCFGALRKRKAAALVANHEASQRETERVDSQVSVRFVKYCFCCLPFVARLVVGDFFEFKQATILLSFAVVNFHANRVRRSKRQQRSDDGRALSCVSSSSSYLCIIKLNVVGV